MFFVYNCHILKKEGFVVKIRTVNDLMKPNTYFFVARKKGGEKNGDPIVIVLCSECRDFETKIIIFLERMGVTYMMKKGLSLVEALSSKKKRSSSLKEKEAMVGPLLSNTKVLFVERKDIWEKTQKAINRFLSK